MTVDLSKKLKISLMIFALVSAVCFTLLVLPENAGISVPMFVIIQFVYMWFLVENKKRLLFMIPVFVMALNCAVSASAVWRISNLAVCGLMYGCMFVNFDFKRDSLSFFGEVMEKTFSPFGIFDLPATWILELNSENAPVIKRVAIALAIAIPCAAVLMLVLVNADMVFYVKTNDFFANIFENINLVSVFKILCGITAGLFVFGIVYNSYDKSEPHINRHAYKGDALIINIFLFVVLVVYTLFVIVQFKYLFAGSALPGGLSYTEYARKGFFELLWLTGINLAVILTVIRLTRHCDGKTLLVTKILCHYLCAVTVVLLVSSFYRMLLYTWDDGFTRLRFFVMGFLIFEAAGLLITFVYIAKPKFNIALIYGTIAVVYYTVLNLVPADNIIAKNQIDIYLNGGRDGLHYVFTLSADAAPAMEYLYNNTDDDVIRNAVKQFLKNNTYSEIPERWQRYNFSTKRAEKIYEKLK